MIIKNVLINFKVRSGIESDKTVPEILNTQEKNVPVVNKYVF